MTQNIQWYSLSISRLNLAGVFLQQLGAMGSGSSPNANDWTPNSHSSNFFPFPEVVASYCDCPVNMPTSLGMFEGPFAIIILMIQCGPINKVFFGLKTLLDYLHKPRAQVPPRMFHHSGVSKPELPIGFSKQKMTPSLSWKDYSWHNFNQIWCFHLFIIMFLGCYNPCWSQLLISCPLIFSPLATALPQISKHPPVTQSDLRKSFFWIRKVHNGCYHNTTLLLGVILRGRRASLAWFHRWQAQGREVIYLKLYLKAEVQAGKDPGSSDFQFHYTV